MPGPLKFALSQLLYLPPHLLLPSHVRFPFFLLMHGSNSVFPLTNLAQLKLGLAAVVVL